MTATRILPGTFLSSLLLCALTAGAARAATQAADVPPLAPARDVTVLYDVQPDGAPQPQPVRVYFRAGGVVMRIDGPPGPGGGSSGAMILDRNAKLMIVVVNQPRIYMQIPEREIVRSPFVLDASMQFARTGAGSVAGLPCVQWSIVSGKGSATACVTADGVVLSEAGVDGDGAKGRLVARSVQYAALNPALFAPPPGFQRAEHPEGLGHGLGPDGTSSGPMLSGPPAGPPGPSGPPAGMPGPDGR